MRIKVWGCRGSIPSPGSETSLYGGNTTCVEVRLEDQSLIVIDAGSGIRKLGLLLMKEKKPQTVHLLLTHAHWDHLQGFPFFVPAYMNTFTIRVSGGLAERESLRSFLEHQMEPPYFPVKFSQLQASFEFLHEANPELKIGGAQIVPLPLNHPNGGYGYRFTEKAKTFVFLTDNELGYGHPGGLSESDYVEACRSADLLFHDAQFTEEEYRITRGWGHSTFQAATQLSMKAGVKRFGIFHHDPRRTDQDLDGFVSACRDQIARHGSGVECFGVKEGMEILL